MASDIWISLTMKIMALGHSLRDAQRMAAVILVERLLVYIILGYHLPADEPDGSMGYFPVTRTIPAGGPADFCGILLAVVPNTDAAVLHCGPLAA